MMFRKIINSMFPLGRGEPRDEPMSDDDLIAMSNPAQVRKQLLWYWVKYLEGNFPEGHRPMTQYEWMSAKVFDHENR